MAKLKTNIGRLWLPGDGITIDHNTPPEVIDRLLERRPDLKKKFTNIKKRKNDTKKDDNQE